MSFGQKITGSHQPIDQLKRPSTRVVEAVAEIEGADQTEIPALYEAIDPDALNALAEDGVQLSFDYAGYRIEVSGTGIIVEQTTEPNA